MGLLSIFKLQTFEASGDWSSPLIAEYGPMSSLIELVEEMELVVKEVDLKIKQRISIPFKKYILDSNNSCVSKFAYYYGNTGCRVFK